MTTSNYTKLNPNDLAGFTGTEHHYFLPLFPNMIYTDGIRYLANQYQMYWLLTDTATFLPNITKSHPDYLYCFILRQLAPGEAELIVTDGNNGDQPLFSYKYEAANFEFISHDKEGNRIKEMKLFLQQGENEQGKINYYLMLPSEY